MKGRLLIAVGVIVALFAIGCGGDSGPSVPTSDEIAQCFKEEGAKPVSQGTEKGVPTVKGLLNGDEIIGVELTEDKAKTEKSLEQLKKLELLQAFEALEGEAVGIVTEAKNKDLVLGCLEGE